MDETIRRQVVLDALDEIETEVAEGRGFQYSKWRQYFAELPSAQSSISVENENDLQQSCNKLATNDIDIQETDGVYEHCDDCIHEADSIDICILRQCKHAIAELKECYEPKKKSGKWERKWEDWRHQISWLECSCCHAGYLDPYDYCPSCGAEMKDEST